MFAAITVQATQEGHEAQTDCEKPRVHLSVLARIDDGGWQTLHGIPPRSIASSKGMSMQFLVHLLAQVQDR